MEIPSIIKSSVPRAVLKHKGDIATVAVDGQLETQSVGPDGTLLAADSSQPSGLKWIDAAAASFAIKWGSINGTLSNQEDLQDALNGKEPANANIQAHIAATGNPHGTTKAQIGLGDVTNEAQIPKTIGTAKGSLLGFSGSGAPAEVLLGADSQVLTADSTQPAGVAWKNVPSGTATWGSIGGTLSDQVDLQTALDSKVPTTSGTSILKGNGTGGFANAVAGIDYLAPDGDASQLTGLTPAQVGLGDVPNIDATKPANISQDSTHRFVTDIEKTSWNGKQDLLGFTPVPDTRTVAGHGLASDVVISKSDVGLGNVPNLDTSIPANITQDSTHRFVTDAEKSTWNGKQDALDFTPVPNTRKVAGHPLTSDVTVTKSDVGLGNVTNDAQLKAAANDFASFPDKTSPASADLILIEDSAANGAKKKVQLGNLPGGAILPSQTGHAGQFLTTDGASPSWGLPAVSSAAWQAITTKPELTVGDTGCGSTIQEALTAIGANEKTLVVPPGNYTGPATVPSNVTIRFARGALLTSGALTINGQLQAGDYQILNGGMLVIGATCRNEYVNPRWWGAKGDDDSAGGGTDDYPALTAMVTALGTVPMTVKFFPGTYKIGTDLTFPATIHLSFVRGAMISPDTVAGGTTLSNVDRKLDGTGTVAATNLYRITGSGTKFFSSHQLLPGMFVTVNGERRQVCHVEGESTAYVTTPFSAASTAVPIYGSNNMITSGAAHGLASSHFIYLTTGGKTYTLPVAVVGTWSSGGVDATHFQLMTQPPVTFSSISGGTYGTAETWCRAVRVTISGSLEDNNYQMFTGRGQVYFTKGVVPFVRPEWWGAKANDNSTDTAQKRANDHAFMWAMYSMANYNPGYQGNFPRTVIELSGYEYYLYDSLYFIPAIFIKNGTLQWKNTLVMPAVLDCGLNHSTNYQVESTTNQGFINARIVNYHAANSFYSHAICLTNNNKCFKFLNSYAFVLGYTGNSQAWAFYAPEAAIATIDNCELQAPNGLFCPGESRVRNAFITAGASISSFTWTPGTNWSVASGTLTAAAANESTIYATVGGLLRCSNNRWYHLWYTIAAGMTGKVTPYLGGVAGTVRTTAGTYCDEFYLTEPAEEYVKFIAGSGADAFTGSISGIKVKTGLGIVDNDDVKITDCLVQGESGCVAGLVLTQNKSTYTGNNFQACDDGIVFSGYSIKDISLYSNMVGNGGNRHAIYIRNTATPRDVFMEGNKIYGGTYGYAINATSSSDSALHNPLDLNSDIREIRITANFIYPGGLGTMNIQREGVQAFDNFGVDGSWKYELSGATTLYPCAKHIKLIGSNISRIKYGSPGHELEIFCDDSSSVAEFTETEVYSFRKVGVTYTANNAAFAYFPNFGTLAVDDAFCVGFNYPDTWVSTDKFAAVRINVATPMTLDATFVWEYSTGSSTWAALTTDDVTPGNLFKVAGVRILKFVPPADWNSNTQPGWRAYYVRCRCTAIGTSGVGGANGTDKVRVSNVRINGDFGGAGTFTAGKLGVLKLKRTSNGIWVETGRSIIPGP
jgi:hypothetical protein